MNSPNEIFTSAAVGAGFWYAAALFIKHTRQYKLFTPNNQVYMLAVTPIIAKLSMEVIHRIMGGIESPSVYLHRLAVLTASATLIDGLVISTPRLRELFYGTDGDFTLESAWLLWGIGNCFFFGLHSLSGKEKAK